MQIYILHRSNPGEMRQKKKCGVNSQSIKEIIVADDHILLLAEKPKFLSFKFKLEA